MRNTYENVCQRANERGVLQVFFSWVQSGHFLLHSRFFSCTLHFSYPYFLHQSCLFFFTPLCNFSIGKGRNCTLVFAQQRERVIEGSAARWSGSKDTTFWLKRYQQYINYPEKDTKSSFIAYLLTKKKTQIYQFGIKRYHLATLIEGLQERKLLDPFAANPTSPTILSWPTSFFTRTYTRASYKT